MNTINLVKKYDIVETAKLIQEDDEAVYGDDGYVGAKHRNEFKEDEHLFGIELLVNGCKVKHLFLIVKKVVWIYEKNMNRSMCYSLVQILRCAIEWGNKRFLHGVSVSFFGRNSKSYKIAPNIIKNIYQF